MKFFIIAGVCTSLGLGGRWHSLLACLLARMNETKLNGMDWVVYAFELFLSWPSTF